MARVPSVNTRNKRVRKSMAEGGGPSPLAVSGDWKNKRVPRAWKQQLPGTAYPCNDPAIGSEVLLRGDAELSEVVGCATPVGPSLLQRGRVSDRYEHQGALMVRLPLGVEVPVPRSVVRERQRLAREPSRETCSCTGVPFPHRKGSLVECLYSAGGVEALADRARDRYEEGDDDGQREALALLAAVEARQGARYQDAERRRAEGKGAYRKRVSAAKRDARSEGWAFK